MKGKKRIDLENKVYEINALVSLGFKQTEIAKILNAGKSTLWTYVGSEEERLTKHLHFYWKNALSRCYNTKNASYKNYGARGIGVCKEWHDFTIFKKWAYTNGYSKNTPSLNRKNENLDYYPENCNFITLVDQQRVGKRGVKFSKEKADEVRKLYSTGKYTKKELCFLFGIKWNREGGTIIHDILHNRTWI